MCHVFQRYSVNYAEGARFVSLQRMTILTVRVHGFPSARNRLGSTLKSAKTTAFYAHSNSVFTVIRNYRNLTALIQ